MSIRERHVRQKRPTKQQRAKQLTQEVFNGAPDWVKSAAVDAGGGAWFYSVGKDVLRVVLTRCESERWSCTHIDDATCEFIGEYDASDWQTSAIDRVKQSEVLDKFECIHCGEVYVRHQLRTTFCDNCDRVLEIRKVELWSWSGLLQHLVDAANITTTDKVLVPVIANDLLLNLIPDGGRVSALVSNKWWFQRLRWTARVALLVPKDITKLNWQRRFDRILFVSARSKEVAEAQILASITLLADDAKLVVLVPASISAYLVANIPPITASRLLETEAGDKFRILTYEV